jgi:hypothetical protein
VVSKLCDICFGRKTITLPVRMTSLRAFPVGAPAPLEAVAHRRVYPCPECSPNGTPMEKVAIVREWREFATGLKHDPRFLGHVQEVTAHELVAKLISNGYIHFREGRLDEMNMTRELHATLAVVHPDHVEKLGDRIARRQMDVADMVATEAKAQILNWGSAVGALHIYKQDACRFIGEVLTATKKRLDKESKVAAVPKTKEG